MTTTPNRRLLRVHAPTDAANDRPVEAAPSGPDVARWARAWVEAQLDPDLLAHDSHPHWWAVEKLLVFSAAGRFEVCWRVVLEVVRITSDPDVLGVLAAGPLEDLVEQAGPAFVDRIERQAWTDPAFRRLLDVAWPCGSPEVRARIEAARRWGSIAAPSLPRQLH
jgi:hypothetical protein